MLLMPRVTVTPLSDGKDTPERCRGILSKEDDQELPEMHGHSFDEGALWWGLGSTYVYIYAGAFLPVELSRRHPQDVFCSST